MARLNIMQTIEPTSGEHLLIEERPQWFRNWERTGLLSIDDKNADGRLQYVADPTRNELVKLDNDILVLANPEIAQLPNWIIALVAAGGLAAALSTAAGLLLAISSAISSSTKYAIVGTSPLTWRKTRITASAASSIYSSGAASKLARMEACFSCAKPQFSS